MFSLIGSNVYSQLYEHRQDVAEVHRRLAYALDAFWLVNDAIVSRIVRGFRIAAVALGVEVLLLLSSVGVTLV